MAPISRKPQRPKRAPTAYLIFMKKYLRAQSIKSRKDAQRAVREGAKKWHTLSQAEKDRYMRSSLKAREEWTHAMREYKSKLQAYKRPPTPFAMFLKDYIWGEYDEGDGKPFKVPEMCKKAAVKWRKLDAKTREYYSREYQAQFQAYQMRRQDEELMELDDADSSFAIPSTSAQAKLSLKDREARARSRAAQFWSRKTRDNEKVKQLSINESGCDEVKDCTTTEASPAGEEPNANPPAKSNNYGKRRASMYGRTRASKAPRRSLAARTRKSSKFYGRNRRARK